jgi:hypothetical protein
MSPFGSCSGRSPDLYGFCYFSVALFRVALLEFALYSRVLWQEPRCLCLYETDEPPLAVPRRSRPSGSSVLGSVHRRN